MKQNKKVRQKLIKYWMEDNALFTGSKCFFGEGEDSDYVVTFKMLQQMEKEYPYTAELITNSNKLEVDEEISQSDKDPYAYHSAKFEVDEEIINVIVAKEDELKEWKFATQKFINNCICPYFKIKANRVKVFEEYRQEHRSENLWKNLLIIPTE